MWDVKLKVILFVKLKSICFILTMWDVKKLTANLVFPLPLGFILTMWDVKTFFLLYFFLCSIGFILTMWDVKTERTHTAKEGITFYINYVGCKGDVFVIMRKKHGKFYINYVGCKVKLSHDFCFTLSSFILTMWDVKSIEYSIPIQDILVLY